MDEFVVQGAALIKQRRRQITALKAELARLAVQNARERTVNRAELMGSAWHRLQNALYMLGLLERALGKLQRPRHHRSNRPTQRARNVVSRIC